MCGIAGIMNLEGRPPELEELQQMCAAMLHRGPNDDGFYLGHGAGLGMRRLSIIDLQTGKQPVCNEDRSVWAVLNGEIYNFRELRSDLMGRGHRFYTATDTEVIVHLYEEYGTRCVEKMRGMFGFGLWDERRKRLLLVRDRLGIKPLYYSLAQGRLIFASELKALLALPDVARRLNWRAVGHLFSFLTTPASDAIIAGVHKLEPGHMIVAAPGKKIAPRPYWDVDFAPDYGHSEEYFIQRFREILNESVQLHLISDVPLGAFLSGGIDSSTVVSSAARSVSQSMRTFSIGFGDRDYDELDFARLVAAKFATKSHEMVLQPDIVEHLDDLAWHLDEPFGDSSAIPTYMVSKLASEHVTVVLSGDGGDELFGGYDKYLVESRERRRDGLPSFARRLMRYVSKRIPEGGKGKNFLYRRSLLGAERYLDAVSIFRSDDQRKLFPPEVYARLELDGLLQEKIHRLSEMKCHWLSALQYHDLKTYLPLDILTKVDRMSMAHSIEARVPLLDHKVVEFAATIPPELHLRNGTGKYLLKQAMRDLLPEEVIDRPKRGFAIPLDRWFRGTLGGFVRELLLSETSKNRGIFESHRIEELLGLHQKGRPLDLHLWTLISFELWCRRFLDRGPVPRLPRPSSGDSGSPFFSPGPNHSSVPAGTISPPWTLEKR